MTKSQYIIIYNTVCMTAVTSTGDGIDGFIYVLNSLNMSNARGQGQGQLVES
jgi:hypothetical protein